MSAPNNSKDALNLIGLTYDKVQDVLNGLKLPYRVVNIQSGVDRVSNLMKSADYVSCRFNLRLSRASGSVSGAVSVGVTNGSNNTKVSIESLLQEANLFPQRFVVSGWSMG